MPGQALISLRDIHLGFEDREVLAGISFEVAHGETKVLLGETGTGKTLILKLAAGLIQADSGQVLVMAILMLPSCEAATDSTAPSNTPSR